MHSKITADGLAAHGSFGSWSLRPVTQADSPAISRLAASTGVFTPAELACLDEDMSSYHSGLYGDDDTGDHVIACHWDGMIYGFAHYGPAAITDNTWYLYWIAVARSSQKMGFGKALLNEMESDIIRRNGRLILIETSSAPNYEPTRSFYLRNGYELCATIRNYYKDGDSKCIFSKTLK